MAARNLRRMRLRTTALPIFFVTVNPNLGPDACSGLAISGSPEVFLSEAGLFLWRPSSRNAGVDQRRPPRTLRNSRRFFRVATAITRSVLRPAMLAPQLFAGRETTCKSGSIRLKGACGPLHGDGRGCAGRPWSACACESRDGAYARACLAGMFFSRIRLQVQIAGHAGTGSSFCPPWAALQDRRIMFIVKWACIRRSAR